MRLDSVAVAIRSKNAGPCLLTFDIIFTDAAWFRRATESEARLRDYVASNYHQRPEDVRIFPHPPSQAVKITIPRARMSGSLGDSDVYGAQQHARLMNFDL